MDRFLNTKIEKIVSKNSSILIFFCVAVLIFYGNVLFGDFVFDDNIFIENNVQIRSLLNIPEIYESNTTSGSGLSGDNFYRPNQQLIYTLLYSLFGLSTFFFHLVPIIFHILNGFLVFLLFTKLGISRRNSFLGVLIFLLHPILTQAVSYVSGLSEPLVTTSIFAAILLFIQSMKEVSLKRYLCWVVASSILFAFGLFSKESGLILLPLILIVGIFLYKKGLLTNLKRFGLVLLILSIISVLYIYLRLNFLNFTGVLGLTTYNNLYTENLWVRIVTFIYVLPEYFKMILFPKDLYYEKSYFAISAILVTQSAVSIVIIVTSFYVAIKSLVKKNGELFLGIGWFFVAMLPFYGIIPMNAIYLEHWLYIPLIGIIFCLAYLFDEYQDFSKKILPGLLVFILIVFGLRVMARNAEWGDPIKFYRNELQYAPQSARIHNNLAMEFADRDDCLSAIPHYEEAIAISDVYPQTHQNLGKCLEAIEYFDEAYQEYVRALVIEPNFSYSISSLHNLLTLFSDPRAPKFLDLYNRKEAGEELQWEDILEALAR